MSGSTESQQEGFDWSFRSLLKSARDAVDAVEAEAEELEAEAESLEALAGSKLEDYKRVLNSALSRIGIFLFVVLPVVFISLMHIGGLIMCYFSKWTFERGHNLMASAMTGGAIILPAENPAGFNNKLALSCAACFGVGIFGFTVAAISNSLVAPVVHVLGIEVKDSEDEDDNGQSTGVIGRLGLLAFGIMVFNLICAVIFGTFISFMQGWSVFTGFKTMASLILGGGINFHNMGVVTREGRMLYTVVGVWSWSMSGLVVAVAGDPGHKIVMKLLGIKLDDRATPTQALYLLAFLVFIVMPMTILSVMMSVATIMKPLTPWSFRGAFWAALPAITGGAAALSDERNPPLTLLGALIIVCASSAGFFILSIMMGVGGELVGPLVEGPILGPYLGKPRTVGHSILALFGVSAVLIPILVFFASLFVGTMMASVMGWTSREGILWCVDVQLGGGMDLVTKKPTTEVGMLFGAIVTSWSLGIAIFAIGLSGSPVIVPLIDSLGMTVDPEELEVFSITPKRRMPILAAETLTSYGSAA
mmetsp:Transcript_54946/g.96360  ORF Transcript_54946/g.96360 Transcript_54946/m.96360 type:complete len:533 (+) Transcript_54946:42-1640(+)